MDQSFHIALQIDLRITNNKKNWYFELCNKSLRFCLALLLSWKAFNIQENQYLGFLFSNWILRQMSIHINVLTKFFPSHLVLSKGTTGKDIQIYEIHKTYQFTCFDRRINNYSDKMVVIETFII